MASLKHSTPKVSAYSVYTRNTAKTINSNLDVKAPSNRKRKADVVEIVNGKTSEEQIVKPKRGRKKKVVQEILVTENSHSDAELDEETENNQEAYEDDASICFKRPDSPDLDVSQKQAVPCGNEAADEAFRWLISPAKPELFFEKKFDKKPFLIRRSNSNYYKGLYSYKEFKKTVEENYLNYNSEIDVVAFVDGERKPLVPENKVLFSCLLSAFKQGYSIRMRNPQVYSKSLGSLCSLLQEYFSSDVGANMYFTPADTQGFPPHYDDIDAFILQIEGKKLWKLYTPSDADMLARYPSPDLNEADIGEPYMEVELHPGDMLYFPRGYIHQAKATPDAHSMHITLSTNQLNTMGDFVEEALTHALSSAMEEDIEFRKSLPKDYLNYLGHVNSDNNSKERQDFQKKVSSLIDKTLQYVSIDYAADAHSIPFIHCSLPPFLNQKEQACSVYGNGSVMDKDGKVLITPELTLKTKIRLLRKRAFRLVVDTDGPRLLHSFGNSKNRKEKDVSAIDVNLDNVPALTALFTTNPEFVKIEDLPHGKPKVLLACLQELYENGLLMTEEPLVLEE